MTLNIVFRYKATLAVSKRWDVTYMSPMKKLLTILILFLPALSCSIFGPTSTNDGQTQPSTAEPLLIETTLLTDATDTPSEGIEHALKSIRKLKIRIDAQMTDGRKILIGNAQFESLGEDDNPIRYLSLQPNDLLSSVVGSWEIELFATHDQVLYRGPLSDYQWTELPAEAPHLASFSELSKRTLDSLLNSTGLHLSSVHLDNDWDFLGITEFDGEKVYRFQNKSKLGLAWNEILPINGISYSDGEIASTITELWIGVADNLPQRVRHSVLIPEFVITEGETINFSFEVNLYPYDYNEPLDLPNELLPYLQ